jgi:hypothetical protein
MDPSGWLPGIPAAEYIRTASFPRALANSQLFVIGYNPVARDSALYIGLTNKNATLSDEVQWRLQRVDATLNTDGIVRRVLKIGEISFIAGNFRQTDPNQQSASNIAIMSKISSPGSKGMALLPLGNGLDGAVRSMRAFRGSLVVGGLFTKAQNSDSHSAINCGGLAYWNLSTEQWSKVGKSTLNGAIHDIIVISDQLIIVAGFFSHVDGLLVNNIALHRGELEKSGTWEALGGGVSGGYIVCLAAKGSSLYAGGTFITVETGGVRKTSKYLALWDGFRQGFIDITHTC